MKSMPFLRNPWKKEGKTNALPAGTMSPTKDGFWDEVDKKAAIFPVRKVDNTLHVFASNAGGGNIVRPALNSINGSLHITVPSHPDGQKNLNDSKQLSSSPTFPHTSKRRPSDLNLTHSPVHAAQPSSLDPPALSLLGSVHSATEPSVRKFATLPCSPPRTDPSWLSPDLPSKTLLSKRSMPELDGIWKNFLEDVEEDPQSLRELEPAVLGHLRNRAQSTSQVQCVQSHKDLFSSLPSSPVLYAPRRTSVLLWNAAMDMPSPTKRSPVAMNAAYPSIPPEPVPDPRRPLSPASVHLPYLSSSDDQTSTEDSSENTAIDFPLSMFPPPPPLSLRDRSSLSSLRAYVPGSGSTTPDSTPTTPITPRGVYVTGVTPESGNVELFDIPSSPLSMPFISPKYPNLTSQSESYTRRIVTRTKSSFNLRRVRSSNLHRPSSSDSTSDKPQHFQQAHVYARVPLRMDVHDEARSLAADVKETGMSVAGLPRSVSPLEVRWGYAL